MWTLTMDSHSYGSMVQHGGPVPSGALFVEPDTSGDDYLPLNGPNHIRSAVLAQYGLDASASGRSITVTFVAPGAAIEAAVQRAIKAMRMPGVRDEDDGSASAPAKVD